jgi:hypothetical protein
MKYLFTIFCIILCSCTSWLREDHAFYFDEEKFKSEWNAWKSQDIKNYSFTLKGELPYWNYPRAKNYVAAILMFPYEVRIVVKNGIMDSFEYIGKIPYNEGSNDSIYGPVYTSISDMYQKMHDQIKRHKSEFLNDSRGCIISWRHEMKYDPKYHYITRYNPTYRTDSGCIVDTTLDEVTVSDFTEN